MKYFIFKQKHMFLPDFVKNIRTEKMTYYSFGGINDFYTIDIKILRKLKLENLDNTISEDDKKFLEYLLNNNFVGIYSTEDEVKKTLGLSWSQSNIFSGSIGMGISASI